MDPNINAGSIMNLIYSIRDNFEEISNKNVSDEELRLLGNLLVTVEEFSEKLNKKYVIPENQFGANCPECGNKPILSCKCWIGDRVCSNGHGWVVCEKHRKIHTTTKNIHSMRPIEKIDCVCSLFFK